MQACACMMGWGCEGSASDKNIAFMVLRVVACDNCRFVIKLIYIDLAKSVEA